MKKYKFKIGDNVRLKNTNRIGIVTNYVDLETPYLIDDTFAFGEWQLEKLEQKEFKIGQYVCRIDDAETIYKVEKYFGDGLYYMREIYPFRERFIENADENIYGNYGGRYILYDKEYIIEEQEICYTRKKKIKLKDIDK